MTTETANNKTIIIEQNKRLSECILWKMQRDYFEQQGINAWVNQVPFYITSNPFIATAYAKIAVRFIHDWVTRHPESKKHPFYIMELGTGSGRFSYYALKAIQDVKHELEMEDVSIVYVMSDFTKHNLEYYQSHHALLPYIKNGLVDFAIYDMENESPIHLIQSKIELNQKTLTNPLTLFGNYIFDTISHDSFTVQNGKIYELLVSLSTNEDNIKDGLPIDWEKITIDRHQNEIHGAYYRDPHLDSILELYKNNLIDTSFLIPIGSIRALNYLKKLSHNKFFLISSDKAYSQMASLENLGHPSMAFHGSFSMMVNLHAVGEYLKNTGGDCFLQTTRRGIKTCVFSSGFKFSDFMETRNAVQTHIEEFSPSDYFNLHRYMSGDTGQTADLDTIVSHLELSKWDPYIYIRLSNRISSIVDEADSDSVAFLKRNMHKLAANYYYMPKAECVLFEIGVFYHALKNYEQALNYYAQAEHFVGEQFGLSYNVALCLHHSNRNEEALKRFKRSVELDGDSKEAKDWVAFLEKSRSEKKYEPKNIQRG